jgi:phosphotransferase system enzyme I (PtsI)
MGVPAVVACPGVMRLEDGVRVVIDGSAGQVVADPDEEQVCAAQARAEARRVARAAFVGLGRTRDGHQVDLLANVGGPGDVEAAVAAGAEGVGLLRTEFLFLGRASPPPWRSRPPPTRPCSKPSRAARWSSGPSTPARRVRKMRSCSSLGLVE